MIVRAHGRCGRNCAPIPQQASVPARLDQKLLVHRRQRPPDEPVGDPVGRVKSDLLEGAHLPPENRGRELDDRPFRRGALEHPGVRGIVTLADGRDELEHQGRRRVDGQLQGRHAESADLGHAMHLSLIHI